MDDPKEFSVDRVFEIYADSVQMPSCARKKAREVFVTGMMCIVEFMDFTTKQAMKNEKLLVPCVLATNGMRAAVLKAESEYQKDSNSRN